MITTPKIKTFFCLPKEYAPTGAWVQDLLAGKPVQVPAGGGRCLSINWIYQTWALLISSGTPCYALFNAPSTEGIVISLGVSASTTLKMPDTPFFVDIVADSSPHPAAHLHLVQNKAYAKRLPNAIFIPHWSQPGIVPRDSQRGDRFENLCFYGHSNNLARELQTPQWRQQLQDELGIQLHLPRVEHWHDYSQTDCVIAIRDFSHSPHWNKPATKLYNSWLAGVPFIGGRDSAYAAEGRPGIDYLVATSPEEVFQQLRSLKENRSLRSQLVNNGSIAAKEFTREAILERWRKLIETTIPSLARQWEQKTKRQRSFFSFRQKADLFLESNSWSHLFRRPTPSRLETIFCIQQDSFPSPEWIEAWNKGTFLPLHKDKKQIRPHISIYQTWSLLKESGVPCHLIHDIPISDIAIFLTTSLDKKYKPSIASNLFLIDVVADAIPHPATHFHIVRNKAHTRWLPRSVFIPEWPEPNLIPRDPHRGDRFENVCFLGDPTQLALEFIFPTWSERLKKELQLNFKIKTLNQCHDYSDVDAVIALEDILSGGYSHKPATKLHNAWLAGVPFIGGLDSAYAADGRPGVDHLVASSAERVFDHLRHLKEDLTFRRQLVFHGTESGKSFTQEAILKQWKFFLLETLPRIAERWQKKSVLQRHCYMVTQRLFYFLNRYLNSKQK